MASIFLASSATTIQTWSSTAPYGKIEGVGPGGNGAGPQTGAKGGPAGAGGSYSAANNVFLPPTFYYYLPGGGSGNDAWANALNLETQSQSLSNAAWGNTNITMTGSQTAPDGTATAWKMVENAAANVQHYINQTYTFPGSVSQTSTFTCSFYIKQLAGSAHRWFQYNMVNSGFANGVTFHIDCGSATLAAVTPTQFGSATSTVIAYGVITDTIATGSSGNGWYRAYLTASMPADTLDAGYHYLASAVGTNTYTGDGASGCLLWGFQKTWGSDLKPYTPTTTVAIYSVLAKAGTNATTTAAGVSQADGQGDIVNQGGNGNLPASGSTGGGGGGAGGPNGAGSNSSSSTGGAADNSTVAGASSDNAGNSGTEFDGSHGCGSGAGGSTTTNNGRTGGNYGGGGSGSGGTGTTGGAGGSALFAISPLTVPRGHARPDTIGLTSIPPDPYPLIGLRLPSNIMAVPVNNPPLAGPPGQDFPWASVTADPYPITKGLLPASITSVPVNSPPPNGPLGIDLPWASTPPDPFPITKGPLPASLTAVPVNTPPWPGPQGLKLPFAELPPDPHPFGGFWSLRLPISITAVRVDAPPVDGPIGRQWPWHETLPDPYPLSGFWALRVPCSVSAVPVNNPPGITAALAQTVSGFGAWADMPLPARPPFPQALAAGVPVSSFTADAILGWAQDIQAPIVPRGLNPTITAVPVNSPPWAAPPGLQWPWPSTPPDPYPIVKGPLPSSITAVPVNNPPWISAPASTKWPLELPPDPQPLNIGFWALRVPVSVSAVPVNNPPFPGSPWRGSWPWPYQGLDPYPIVKGLNSPGATAFTPVNNPPWHGVSLSTILGYFSAPLDPYPITKGPLPAQITNVPVNSPPWQAPLSVNQNFLWPSTPPDPYPVTARLVPPIVAAVPVNNPPFPGGLANSEIAGWFSAHPDPYPLVKGPLPAFLTAVRVDNPPVISPAADPAFGYEAPGNSFWPVQAKLLPPVLIAVQVNNPPFPGGISRPDQAGWFSSLPDPYPIVSLPLPASFRAVQVDNPPQIQRAQLNAALEIPSLSAQVLLQWPGGGFVSDIPIYGAYSGLYDWAAESMPITARFVATFAFTKPGLVKHFSISMATAVNFTLIRQ